MSYAMDMLRWWINKDPFTERELQLLKRDRSTDLKVYNDSEEYRKIVTDNFIKYISYGNISSETHNVTFGDSATELIQRLFKHYHADNDNTLVVYSNNEHHSAKNCVDKCKHTLEVSYDEEILLSKVDRVVNEAKKFKSTLIYIIGTQISNGLISPQDFFIKLRKELDKNNIDYTLILDDVHGMLFVPRDYSLFDYVIYTCHAWVLNYDAGVLISNRKKKKFGYEIANWATDYMENMNILFKRWDKIHTFKAVMMNFFVKYLVNPKVKLPLFGSDQIFAPYLINDEHLIDEKLADVLEDYHIRCEGVDSPQIYFRFRISEIIMYTEEDLQKLEKGFKILDSILLEE